MLDCDAGPLRAFDAMFECNQLLSSRYIDQVGRKGLYGNWPRIRNELIQHFSADHQLSAYLRTHRAAPKSFQMCGIEWSCDPRIGPHLIVAWHPSCIIPPATVLRKEGIAYVALSKPD